MGHLHVNGNQRRWELYEYPTTVLSSPTPIEGPYSDTANQICILQHNKLGYLPAWLNDLFLVIR